MTAFDKLIRAAMTVRDVRQRHPEAATIFEEFGFRRSCDDCSIEVAARRQGLRSADVVDALNRRVFGEASPEQES